MSFYENLKSIKAYHGTLKFGERFGWSVRALLKSVKSALYK